ncbi:hypothetical protein MIMGU_mgv1a018867mg, partial [Erythranthe guttata]
ARPWCIANTNSPAPSPAKFQGFIDYACGVVDCSAIRPGGSCYNPNLLSKHASYALNLIYKSFQCQYNSSYDCYNNAAYDGCIYP